VIDNAIFVYYAKHFRFSEGNFFRNTLYIDIEGEVDEIDALSYVSVEVLPKFMTIFFQIHVKWNSVCWKVNYPILILSHYLHSCFFALTFCR